MNNTAMDSLKELKAMKDKYDMSLTLTHTEALHLYCGLVISALDFCKASPVLSNKWAQYLELLHIDSPRDSHAEDFLHLIAPWVEDPADEERFYIADFEIARVLCPIMLSER